MYRTVTGTVGKFPLPSTLDWTVGSGLPTIVPTAHALLHRLGRIRPGDRVLVTVAAGATGMLLGQMAKPAGAGRITGVVSSAAKVAARSAAWVRRRPARRRR